MSLPNTDDPIRYWLQFREVAHTEIVVSWQENKSEYETSEIEYREQGESTWLSGPGSSVTHPFTGAGFDVAERLVHHVVLGSLDPDTAYEFRFTQNGAVRYFKTLPATIGESTTVKFAVGADVYGIFAWMDDVAAQIALREPDFILVNGDLAYADGLSSRLWRWDDYWNIFTSRFTLADNRVIPLLHTIGNHDVLGGYSSDKADAPYFYAFFDFPAAHAGAYKEVRAGDYLSMVLLDTEHTAGTYSAENAQIVWLDSVLEDNTAFDHRLVFQHVPYYPSQRLPNTSQHVRGLTHVAPILEARGITTVFDAHDHLYKRTHRVKAGERHVDGITYLGDGCWGVGIRAGDRFDEWYMDEVHGTEHGNVDNGRHFYEVVIDDDGLTANSINAAGEIFHVYPGEIVEADTSPFADSWTPGEAGKYRIRPRAVYADGTYDAGPPITINVENP